jgi:hypothetical protein
VGGGDEASTSWNDRVRTATRFFLSVTLSVTVLVPGGPVYVKLTVVPVPIRSVLAAPPCVQRYVHGAAGQVPVDLKIVGLLRTAGSGDTMKFATGGRDGEAIATVAKMSRHAKTVAEMVRRKGVPRGWLGV